MAASKTSGGNETIPRSRARAAKPSAAPATAAAEKANVATHNFIIQQQTKLEKSIGKMITEGIAAGMSSMKAELLKQHNVVVGHHMKAHEELAVVTKSVVTSFGTVATILQEQTSTIDSMADELSAMQKRALSLSSRNLKKNRSPVRSEQRRSYHTDDEEDSDYEVASKKLSDRIADQVELKFRRRLDAADMDLFASRSKKKNKR